jgi:hypothetical protein
MDKRTKLIVGAVAALAALGVGTGVGVASSGGDDHPIQGDARQRATQAVLDHVGEGSVTETEMGDGGATYEVEVRLDDGRELEIELDGNFEVIGTERDDDSGEDESGDDD